MCSPELAAEAIVTAAALRGEFLVRDVRIVGERLDVEIVARDGARGRMAIGLPSSGDPQYWIYAPPDDLDDWVGQLMVYLEEEVSTGGLTEHRLREDRDGGSYVVPTGYGWRVADEREHARLADVSTMWDDDAWKRGG